MIVSTLLLFIPRHQDLHNQVFSMALAAGRWLGVRVDLLCSVFIAIVAFVTVLLTQDPGRKVEGILKANLHHCTRYNFVACMRYQSWFTPSLQVQQIFKTRADSHPHDTTDQRNRSDKSSRVNRPPTNQAGKSSRVNRSPTNRAHEYSAAVFDIIAWNFFVSVGGGEEGSNGVLLPPTKDPIQSGVRAGAHLYEKLRFLSSRCDKNRDKLGLHRKGVRRRTTRFLSIFVVTKTIGCIKHVSYCCVKMLS